MMKHLLKNGWLTVDDSGVMRLPFLIKGKLVHPPEVSARAIRDAFAALDKTRGAADAHETYARVGGAQVVRERIVDRDTLSLSDEWRYHVMPELSVADVIEQDIELLVDELYSLPFEAVLEWIDAVRQTLTDNADVVAHVRELDRATSLHPDAYVDMAFTAIPLMLSRSAAEQMIDADLGRLGVSGRRLLDGWVPLPFETMPGPSHMVGASLLPAGTPPAPMLRAMPTKQLHITAGNSPLIPLVSMLRGVWTKSATVVKLPYGATLPGSLLALAAHHAAPDHPITRHLSLVHWRGGDEQVEQILFLPGAFDRVVVWGAPAAVESVRRRALYAKTLCFNPRYSVSFIGREGLADIEDTATRALFDTMVANQKACIASQVHYVEGSVEDAVRYAKAVQSVLKRWDELAPNVIEPHRAGKLKRLSRGALLDAQFFLNESPEFQSGVVVAPHEFRIQDHPMSRLVVVRPVERLEDALSYLHPSVATVGVHPDPRRLELRDRVVARGVSNVVPLGQSARTVSGMAHDGMVVLSELVDWKNA